MRATTHFAALAAAGALALTAGLAAPLAAPAGQPLGPQQAQAAEAAQVAVTPAQKTQGIYSVMIAQTKVNSTKATVTVGKLSALKGAGISRIELSATMSYKGKAKVSKTKSIKALGNSEAFKAAFHLSDQLFASAQEQGKKIMVLMGTRVNLETNFEPFARFVM
ncbi:MAG: hypothetical protein ACI36Y_03435 [Coriobacteriales bacterium]